MAGDRVVCIDESGREFFTKTHKNWVSESEIYTVRRLEGSLTGTTRVLLEEIKNPHIYIQALGGRAEPGFNIVRFVKYEDFILNKF